MKNTLLEEFIRDIIEESRHDYYDQDQDVPHGLSFFEVTKYLSSRFRKAKMALTSGPLDLERSYDPSGGLVNKPAGLWYGCGTAWLDWLEREGHQPAPEEYQIWSLKIDMSRVKSITSEKELQRFSYMYADHSKYSHSGPTTMNWNKASQKFSGIECCPYPVSSDSKLQMKFDSKLQMKFLWYFALDVASGCIWDTSSITNSMLIAEKKDDGWEVYV
jgi:hypothetical protein